MAPAVRPVSPGVGNKDRFNPAEAFPNQRVWGDPGIEPFDRYGKTVGIHGPGQYLFSRV
jgi:hypothetical protein